MSARNIQLKILEFLGDAKGEKKDLESDLKEYKKKNNAEKDPDMKEIYGKNIKDLKVMIKELGVEIDDYGKIIKETKGDIIVAKRKALHKQYDD